MRGTEKLFHAPRRKCITGIVVEASRKCWCIRVGPCVVGPRGGFRTEWLQKLGLGKQRQM